MGAPTVPLSPRPAPNDHLRGQREAKAANGHRVQVNVVLPALRSELIDAGVTPNEAVLRLRRAKPAVWLSGGKKLACFMWLGRVTRAWYGTLWVQSAIDAAAEVNERQTVRSACLVAPGYQGCELSQLDHFGVFRFATPGRVPNEPVV